LVGSCKTQALSRQRHFLIQGGAVATSETTRKTTTTNRRSLQCTRQCIRKVERTATGYLEAIAIQQACPTAIEIALTVWRQMISVSNELAYLRQMASVRNELTNIYDYCFFLCRRAIHQVLGDAWTGFSWQRKEFFCDTAYSLTQHQRISILCGTYHLHQLERRRKRQYSSRVQSLHPANNERGQWDQRNQWEHWDQRDQWDPHFDATCCWPQTNLARTREDDLQLQRQLCKRKRNQQLARREHREATIPVDGASIRKNKPTLGGFTRCGQRRI